jgi:hypothetical protein
MPAAIADLFFLEDLEEVSRTGQLTESDLRSPRTVADWIKTFVTGLNKDLGRAGAVYPFVPMALERKTLWLAPEHVANRGVPQVAELMNGYKRRGLEAEPTDSDDVNYKVIVSRPAPPLCSPRMDGTGEN